MLEIRLLGQFEVRQDDTVLTISSRPAQSLLAYLLLNPGIGHRREQLAGLLAPDSAEENARGVLRHALWRLRKTLGADPLTGRDYLLVDELTIAFDTQAHYWLDTAVVAAPLTAAPATAHLAASLAAYAGDLLPGFYDDWVVLARVRLEAIFEGKMRRLLEQQLAAGCWPDAAEWAERWIALGHSPEAAYCALLVAHAARGDRSRVASAYRRCVEDLRGGLGVEPSAATQQLHERLVKGDSSVGLAQPVTFTLPERPAPRSADDFPAPGKPPFKGLQHFEAADAGLFFGRAALAQYEACRRMLTDELGVERAAETAEPSRRIRADNLKARTPNWEHQSLPLLPAFLEQGTEEVKPPIFVAREQELARLQSFLDKSLEGRGGVAFVTGGPGLGKTALLSEFARRAMAGHADLLVARGNCSAISGLGDPYLPFRDVMAMLTGDVETRWLAGTISRDHARRLWGALPVVVSALLASGSTLVPVILAGEALLARAECALSGWTDLLEPLRTLTAPARIWQAGIAQDFLFKQYAEVLQELARRQPLLMLLDDMQWADNASVGLLFHLGRQLNAGRSRILIVCAYRPEEVAVGRAGERHPLEIVVHEFKRTFGDVWVDLDAAAQREGRHFVNAFLGAERNRLGDEFRAALFKRTAGHPLFTVELLRAMQERGDLLQDARADGAWIAGPDLDWDALPARVEAVIQTRVDRLDPELREIVNIASVEGEVFTSQVVAVVQNAGEGPVLRGLQKLERLHRLVRELGEVRTGAQRAIHYQFSHILIQEYVYRTLSQGERRLLHGQIAAALEHLYQGRLDEIAVQLAHHFEAAANIDQAFRYSLHAAQNAARAYANDEAIMLYARAIALAHELSLGTTALLDLHRGRGRAYEALGDFENARSDYEMVLREAGPAGERRLEWRALLDLAELWTSRDYDQSRDYIDRALELANDLGDPALLAGSLNLVGNWHTNAENPAAGMGYHQKALAIFEQSGAREDLAMTLDRLGLTSMLRGDLAAGVGYYDRAIPIFRAIKDRVGLAASLTGRGIAGNGPYTSPTAVAPSMPGAARNDLEEALQISREISSPSAEAWALWALSLWSTGQGQFGRALDTATSSLRVASAIGHREWIAGSRSILGALYTEILAPEVARPYLEQALDLAQRLRSQHWIHHATGALAATWCLLGQPARAEACLAAVVSGETGMDTMHRRTCWARRAELALAEGEPTLALEIADRLIATAPGLSPGRIITTLWQLKGEALTALRQTEEARALLQAAVENAHEAGERFHLWRTHASLGRLYGVMNREPEAAREFAVARELITDLAREVPGQGFRDSFFERACSMLTSSA
jgi:DNA-binding SARP family transcriptional activator/tetratricopeptide (TPR) repeat protein